MSAKTDKSKLGRKNILMLVRTCVIASFALILAIAASLAWFMTDPPKTDYLQTEVYGGLKATVNLGVLNRDRIREREIYLGYIEEPDLVGYYRSYFIDITNSAVYTRPNTEANLAPGNGDYYRINISLQNVSEARMSVQIVNMKWNKNLSDTARTDLKDHIWVNWFLQGGTIYDRGQSKIFQWDTAVNDYKDNITFAVNILIGTNATFFYYLYLDPDFTIDFGDKEFLVDEPLFIIEHIKVFLN